MGHGSEGNYHRKWGKVRHSSMYEIVALEYDFARIFVNTSIAPSNYLSN